MSDILMVPPVPQPANRSANKPIYIVEAEDISVKGKTQRYRADRIDRFDTHITILGFLIDKAQADKLRGNPNAKEVAGREINYEIPWQKVIRIENITHNKVRKAQGEK